MGADRGGFVSASVALIVGVAIVLDDAVGAALTSALVGPIGMPVSGDGEHPSSLRHAEENLCLAALRHLHQSDVRSFASLLLSRRLAAGTLVEFLVRERLGVFAWSAIAGSKLQPLIPRAVAGALEDQWRQQQQRNLVLRAELSRASAAFRDAGIDFLLLKGLYLSERFYRGLDRRFTWDLDLLVRPSAVSDALVILDRLGFSSPRFHVGLQHVARRVTHALERRRADGLSIDLHWALRRIPGLRIDYADVWGASQMYALGGLECPVPSEEHSLLLVLLGIAADLDRSLCRTRSLWDCYMMMRGLPQIDWPGFLARREKDGSIGLVANALSLTLHRLDCHGEFPSLVQALEAHRQRITEIDAEEVWRMLAHEPHSLANHMRFARWQPLPGWRYATWWAATLPLRMFFARRF